MAKIDYRGYRIESYENGWVMGKVRTRKRSGKEVEVVDGHTYHGTLPKALRALAEQCQRDSEADGLVAMADEVDRITRELGSMLDAGQAIYEAAARAVGEKA